MDGVITKQPLDHNHTPDMTKIDARKKLNDIKERAAATTESTYQIVATFSTGTNAVVAGQLPNVYLIKQAIRQARRTAKVPLPNPTTLEELEIPLEYTQTKTGEIFLLYDSGPGQHRMLIFSTTRNLDLLESSPNWYADGTFKTAPPLFQQIYTIHVLRYNTVIPVIYVLMND